MQKIFSILLITIFTFATPWTTASEAARIKDLVNIDGVRTNKLIGFGLVIGLANN